MKKLVILGGGISGIGAALLAKKNGYDVFVSDKGVISEKEVLTNNDIKWEEGTHSIEKIMTASEVVKSPGIPDSVDLIKRIKKKEISVISEVEFAYRFTNAKIVAITGSNGKTSTKEIIGNLLREIHHTHQTLGNQNNKLGVTLTLLDLEKEHDSLVIEIGTSARGEISDLSSIVKPHIALITNVALAHSDGLGSIKDIAIEKGDILDFLGTEGVAVLPRDSLFYEDWNKRAGNRKVISFGIHESADFKVSSIKVDLRKSRTVFKLRFQGKERFCSINGIGEHNAINAASALATLHALGIDFQISIKDLMGVKLPYRRLTVCDGINGSLIIDDTYNANPDSIKAAINVISSEDKLRKIFIAGQMAELGLNAEILHKDIIEYSNSRMDEIWCIGDLWKKSVKKYNSKVKYFVNNQELLGYALNEIDNKCLVLLKGSRSSAVDQIADLLKLDKRN